MEDLELPYIIIESWKCFDCSLTLQSIIIGENGRYEGVIAKESVENPIWRCKLPKQEDKAKEYLKTNLDLRVIRHKVEHK